MSNRFLPLRSAICLDLLHESFLLLLWPLWWHNKGLVPFAILNWSQSSRTWKKFKEPINQIARMRNSVISLDMGNSSDRGNKYEAKPSREHFWTIHDSRVYETFFRSRGGSRPVYKVCTNLSEFFPKIFLRVYIVKCKWLYGFIIHTPVMISFCLKWHYCNDLQFFLDWKPL